MSRAATAIVDVVPDDVSVDRSVKLLFLHEVKRTVSIAIILMVHFVPGRFTMGFNFWG